MEFHEFSSYEEYVEEQCRLTRRKVRKGRDYLCTTRKTLEEIHDYHKWLISPIVRFGLCHGVRKGEELDVFQNLFRCGHWIGTELVPELCDDIRVFCQDFSYRNEHWIGKFDFIYSNAIDHALCPEDTLRAWISCLNEKGVLYVEWTPWHNMLSDNGNKADCFAASDVELQGLLGKVGEVIHVIETMDDGGRQPVLRKVFCVSHRRAEPQQ